MRLRLRFIVSILVTTVCGIVIAVGLRLGFVTLVDFFSNIFSVLVYAFLTSLGTTILFLATGQWKQKLAQTKGEDKPELTVISTKLKEDEKIREIEVILQDGTVRKHAARFHYVTVKNTGRKSAEDVIAYHDGADRMMFMPFRRKQTFKVDYPGTGSASEHSIETFGEAQAFVVAALNHGKLEWTRTIHPGLVGETFVLLFSMKGFRNLTIPAGSRLYPNYNEGMPCSFRFPLILVGKDMPEYYLTTFKVDVPRWDSLNVEPIGETIRCSVTGRETIPELVSRRKD